MKYLVDASVLCEVMRPAAAPQVVSWLARNEAELAVDPIVLGEIEFGILRLPAGRKRAALQRWFDQTFNAVVCLPFTSQFARRWARLLAELKRKGAQMPIKDSLIAATALHHGLAVATHNLRDFRAAGVDLVDPFVTH